MPKPTSEQLLVLLFVPEGHDYEGFSVKEVVFDDPSGLQRHTVYNLNDLTYWQFHYSSVKAYPIALLNDALNSLKEVKAKTEYHTVYIPVDEAGTGPLTIG